MNQHVVEPSSTVNQSSSLSPSSHSPPHAQLQREYRQHQQELDQPPSRKAHAVTDQESISRTEDARQVVPGRPLSPSVGKQHHGRAGAVGDDDDRRHMKESSSGFSSGQHQQLTSVPRGQSPPSSSTAAAAPDADDPNQAQGAEDAKRSRACEACRGLKVRCDPDPNDGPCKRCKKARRNCVVTMPRRKRQKKTDNRVAELEKKIDALTASLHAKTGVARDHDDLSGGGGGAVAAATAAAGGAEGTGASDGGSEQHPSNTSVDSSHNGGFDLRDRSVLMSEPHWIGQNADGKGWADPPMRVPTGGSLGRQTTFPTSSVAGQKRKVSPGKQSTDDQSSKSPPGSPESIGVGPSFPMRDVDRADVVERGLVTEEHAAELFERYKTQMSKHLPGVVFPPEYSVQTLRKTKPTLFLAIMAVALSENHGLQKVLQRDLMQVFAEKIIITGEKSFEIVQALLVAVIWYWPPDHFEELKFYQLVHIACTMAIDIGLHKVTTPPSEYKAALGFPAHPTRRAIVVDSTSLEARRAWLCCHFLSSNTSMALHRPQLIRWTEYMSESFHLLETSPDAAPTDKYFCCLVRTHQLADDVGVQFSMDDPRALVDVTDTRVQFAMKAFEMRMETYWTSVDKPLKQPALVLCFNCVRQYLHELGLPYESKTPQAHHTFSTDFMKEGMVGSDALLPAHINAITHCLSAIDEMFDTFLAMDVSNIRCLPLFLFVRIATAMVMLVKIGVTASYPGSELGRVLTKDHTRVEFYLDAVVEKFRATAAGEMCFPASKFLIVLVMMRTWFQKHSKHEPHAQASRKSTSAAADTSRNRPKQDGASSAEATPQQRQRSLPHALMQHSPRSHQPNNPTHRNSSSSTPLHLLSEVAAGSSGDPSRDQAPFGSFALFSRPQQGPPPPPQSIFSGSPASTENSLPMGGPGTAYTFPATSNTNTLPMMATASLRPQPWQAAAAAAAASGDPRQQQQQQPPAPSMMGGGGDMFSGMMNMGGLMGGMEMDSSMLIGVPDGYEQNAGIVMQEPWFNELLQAPMDPNMFQF